MEKIRLNYTSVEKVASFGAYPRRVNADATSDESTLPRGRNVIGMDWTMLMVVIKTLWFVLRRE